MRYSHVAPDTTSEKAEADLSIRHFRNSTVGQTGCLRAIAQRYGVGHLPTEAAMVEHEGDVDEGAPH